MSVSLGVTGQRDIYIPIATSDAFGRYWVPGCETLGLTYVRRFEYGLVVTDFELPYVMEELSRLKDWMRSQHSEMDYEPVVERLEGVEKELPKLVSKFREAWIG